MNDEKLTIHQIASYLRDTAQSTWYLKARRIGEDLGGYSPKQIGARMAEINDTYEELIAELKQDPETLDEITYESEALEDGVPTDLKWGCTSSTTWDARPFTAPTLYSKLKDKLPDPS